MTAKQKLSRRQRYSQLSSRLAELDNVQLSSLLSPESSPAGSDWGSSQTLRLGTEKLFVKRIPVSTRELAEPFSTRNLYDLPDYYHYGVGSAGFGVYRELLTHIKTSNWVLSDEISTFPLLYHYRIVPIQPSGKPPDIAAQQRMVASWNGHPGIASYLHDRSHASHELLLFLEYFPQTLKDWLIQHPDQVERALASLHRTIDFLHQHGILHLDTHFLNVLTDGEHFYLSDFGLALDKRFTLDDSEKRFYSRHKHYDYGKSLWSLTFVLRAAYAACSPAGKRKLQNRYGISPDLHAFHASSVLMAHLEDIHTQNLIKLDKSYVECLLRYRSVISLMQGFYIEMHGNDAKDTPFHAARLQRLISNTGR